MKQRFSRRVPLEFHPNQWSEEVKKKKETGVSIFDLTVSNPTEVGLVGNLESFRKLFSKHSDLIYEPNPQGILMARESISEWQRGIGTHVDPDWLWLTSGTSEAYAYLIKLLADPGDSFLIPSPSYPLFEHLLNLEAVQAQTYALRFESNEWRIDWDSIRKEIDSTTRALILVHPNNPTGSALSKVDMKRLMTECEALELPLIVDEVFLRYSFHSGPRIPSFSNFESNGLLFVLNGFSKELGFPQMKLSWIHAKGSPKALKEVKPRLDWISDQYLSVNSEIQKELPALIQLGEEVHSKILQRVQTNAKTLDEFISKHPYLQNATGGAGWNGIIRLPDELEEEGFIHRLLKDTHVLTYPGYFFDLPFPSSMIVSLLPDPALFEKALSKIDPLISTN